MKKFSGFILVLVLLFMFLDPVLAAEPIDVRRDSIVSLGGFEFSSEEIAREISSRLDADAGKISFYITKEFDTSDCNIGNSITLEVTCTTDGQAGKNLKIAAASGTVNFALSGRYYFKSSDETVSNYGIHGSADYTGSSLKNIIWDKYHDVVSKYSKQYSATSSKSTEDVTSGKKLIGSFRLKNTSNNTWCDDAEITITIKYDGSWSSVGNYSAIKVN